MIRKSQLALFLFTITFFANSQAVLAQTGSDFNGTWRGTMNIAADTCGFDHAPWAFKHKIFNSSGSPVVVLFLTDERGIKTWAQVPYIGKNSQGSYFRAVPTKVINLSNEVQMVLSYTYTAVKKGKAKVEFFGGFSNKVTGESCYVVYRGNGKK